MRLARACGASVRARALLRRRSAPQRAAAATMAAPPPPAEPPLPSGGAAAAELRGLTCVGQCSRDTPLVPTEQLPARLAALPLWRLAPSGKAIGREFTARNFMAAMAFFNAVAEVAEAETHHPDLHLTNYRDVRVELSTHAVGGLTLPDFILAAKLDALPVDYSPKWLREHAAAAGGSAA